MDTKHFRSRGAVVGVATAIITTTAFAPTASSAAGTDEGPADRPCFMVQSHWNTAYDGPQPTCPTPTWQTGAAASDTGAARSGAGAGDATVAAAAGRRIVDFMP